MYGLCWAGLENKAGFGEDTPFSHEHRVILWWGTLGHLYISSFRDVLYSFGFFAWITLVPCPVLRGASTSLNAPWGQKIPNAPLCGGEAPRAIRARKKCRDVAKKWASDPRFGAIRATSGPAKRRTLYCACQRPFVYDVAGRSTPYIRAKIK